MKYWLGLLVLGIFVTVGCGRLGNAPAPTRATPAVTAPSPRRTLPPGDYAQSLMHAGRTRTYTIHLPRGISDERAFPLVIMLHGGAGNSEHAARMSGFSTLADQENFIVVYPDGTGRLGEVLLTWNAGNCCGYALDNNIDDVGFIRALIEKLERDHPINPKQIYVTGMSNGGMMAYRLACELADKIAAIAPVAGALNVECKPTAPISVIAFHGMADQHVLFEGGAPRVRADPHPREDKSVAYAMNFWAQHNRCAPTPQRDERGNIIHDTYTNCANGTAVELYAIKGEGHTWPGGKSWLGGDPPTQEISATKVMWEFFKQHPKN
jgi:polyhydroxybutyrate depolymerase